ncbi:unnamed protein product, partial [Porites lobata]
KGHESKRITASNLSLISQIATQSKAIVLSFTSVLSLPLSAPSQISVYFKLERNLSKKRNLIIELAKETIARYLAPSKDL